MKARVHVFLKDGVFDPQGKAVSQALQDMGFSEVHSVRQGKFFDIDTGAVPEEEQKVRLEDYCRKLLANPVIESFSVEVVEP